jgi:hypothetical protein
MTISSRAIVKGVEGKDFLLQLTVHIVEEMSAKTFMWKLENGETF